MSDVATLRESLGKPSDAPGRGEHSCDGAKDGRTATPSRGVPGARGRHVTVGPASQGGTSTPSSAGAGVRR